MLLKIPQILDAAGVARAHELLAAAPWADGRTTAGRQAAQVKNNQQLQPGSEQHRELQALVLQALEKHPLFFSATLPKRVLPPLFNRYAAPAEAARPAATTTATMSTRPSATSAAARRPASGCAPT